MSLPTEGKTFSAPHAAPTAEPIAASSVGPAEALTNSGASASGPGARPSPLVSIVLPTYNGARYLEQSIRSCLDQTYRNWELLIVDDCSTDATPQIIAGFVARDARIRSSRNPVNRKLPGSLNAGFQQARGDYLTWTSDDNLYRPEALSEMVAFLESNGGADVVYADYTLIDDDGKVTGFRAVDDPQVMPHVNPVGACFLYRRKVQEALGGYDEKLFLVEDYDFWIRAARAFCLVPLRRDLYLYRMHAGALTTTAAERLRAPLRRVLERNLPTMKWAGRRHLGMGYARLAHLAFCDGAGGAARKFWLSALVRAPLYVLFSTWRSSVLIFLGPSVYKRLRGRRRRATAEPSPSKS